MMATIPLIQRIANRAFKTFSKRCAVQPQSLDDLSKLVEQIKAQDINLDQQMIQDLGHYEVGCGKAPIVYIEIWEDEVFSMGVFIVRSGAALPLHDHPNMHGIIKLLHGAVRLSSYCEVPQDNIPESLSERLRSFSHQVIKPAQVTHTDVTTESSPCVLTPTRGNFHRISSLGGPAAFLDILAPPYDHASGARECHYFEEVPISSVLNNDTTSDSDIPKDACCIVQTQQPNDFWGDSADYEGPTIHPYQESFQE